jgi:hypothetical protein
MQNFFPLAKLGGQIIATTRLLSATARVSARHPRARKYPFDISTTHGFRAGKRLLSEQFIGKAVGRTWNPPPRCAPQVSRAVVKALPFSGRDAFSCNQK